jgi:hypothetical protein
MALSYIAGALAITAGISGMVWGWSGRLRVWWLPKDLPDRIFIDRLFSLCAGTLLIGVGILIISKTA